MAEELLEKNLTGSEEVADNSVAQDSPIVDENKSDVTENKYQLNTLEMQQPLQDTNINDDAVEVKNVLDEYGYQRDELDEYEQQSGRRVVDYSHVAAETISNTGTGLDGKTIDDVANSKGATPNQIFEMKDLLEQLSYAGYEVWRSLSKIGFWAGTKVAELVAGQDIELTEEEKIRGNPLDYGDSSEARSYVGMAAKPIAQFAAGSYLTGGVAYATRLKGVAAATKGLVKNAYGKKVLTGIFGLLQGMASDVVAFSENEANMSELLNTMGITYTDALVKNPEDSFWAKKLKNSVDGGVFQLAMGAVVGSAKIFSKAGKGIIKGKAAQKAAEEVVETTEKKVAPVVAEALKSDAKEVAQKELEKGIETVVFDEATKTVKGLSQKEKENIVKKVMIDIAEEPTAEYVERISQADLKKLNKKQFENVVYNIKKEAANEAEIAEKAADVAKKFGAREMNEADKNNWVKENVLKLFEDRKNTIESVSGAMQAGAEVSKSQTARRINKLRDYIYENADKLDYDNLLNAMQSLKSQQDFENFFGIADNFVRKGKVSDFFAKVAYVRQNIMLSSGVTQIKDISSTTMHRVLELADTATGAGISALERGGKKLKRLFTKGDIDAAKQRLTMGDVDYVELKEIADNVTGMASFVQDALKYQYRKFTGKLAENELSPVARHMQQVGEGLSKYNPTKQVATKVVPGNGQISKTINGVLNHAGIYVAEAKDDVLHAMFHNADVKTNVASMVRRQVRLGQIKPEDATKEMQRYLRMTEQYAVTDPQKVFEFANGLTDEMRIQAIMKRAANSSTKTVFRDGLTGAMGDVYRTIQRHPSFSIPLRIIAPFQKTGLTIGVERFLKERSLYTPFSAGFRQAMSRGGRESQMAMARLINGLAIQGAAGYGLYTGSIVGPMPKNRSEREMLMSVGAKEYSARIGDKYYSLTDLAGPAGPAIRFALDLTDTYIRAADYAEDHEEYDFEDVAMNVGTLLGDMFWGSTFIGGILDNAERGDVLGLKNVVRSLAAGPRIISETQQILGLNDAEYRKTAYDWMDRVSMNWTGGNHLRRDLYGVPMKAQTVSWVGLVTTQAADDPVTIEMLDRNAFVEIPGTTLEADGVSIQISKEEQNKWLEYMEEIGTYGKMKDFINSKNYKSLPELSKTKALRGRYNELKNEAKKKLIDNSTAIRLKLKEKASSPVPSLNFNPYMDMLRGE